MSNSLNKTGIRDLEETAWKVFDAIDADPSEKVGHKLKALELLVKIRLGGDRVKASTEDASAGRRAVLQDVLRKMNDPL